MPKEDRESSQEVVGLSMAATDLLQVHEKLELSVPFN